MVLYAKNGKNVFDDRLLFCLLNKKHTDVVAILKNVDVKSLVDNEGMTLLHHAINANCLTKTLKYLIERKQCNVDALDANGNTPLMNAMQCKNVPVIKFLLNFNPDVILCGQGKENPLTMIHDPEKKYNPLVNAKVYDLLKRKFSSDSQQIARNLIDAQCSLARAMYFKDASIIEYMLDPGCDIDHLDVTIHCTALHEAMKQMDSLNVKLLIERGADIDIEDGDRRTPLDYYKSGQKESKDVLRALLRDISLDASTIKGYKFAARVLRIGHSDEVELLLRHGFSLEDNTWNDSRRTLLHDIAVNMNPGVMEQLEGKKFDVHAKDLDGKTALWGALRSGIPSNLEFLLKNRADPNDKSYGERTILLSTFEEWTMPHFELLRHDHVECLELLLEYGADVMHKDEISNNTIFDMPLFYLHFSFIQPAISQVAMIEAMGQNVKEDILRKIENNNKYKKFFTLCRSEIEKLRKTMITERFCLFQFITESEERLVRLLRNRELAKSLKQFNFEEYNNSDISFIKRLQKRVQNIVEIAELRSHAASVIKISGFNNYDVLERIISFLDKRSLQKLCDADEVLTNAVE